MKKFIALAVLLGLAALFGRATPHYAYWRLRSALANGDVAAVEETADLDKMAGVAIDIITASTEQVATDNAGVIGGMLARVFGAAIGEPFKLVMGPAAVGQLKASIAKKDFADHVGEFVFDSPMSGMSRVQSYDTSAMVELTGHCRDQITGVKIIFERKPDGLISMFTPYRAVGLERDSLVALTKVCVLGRP